MTYFSFTCVFGWKGYMHLSAEASGAQKRKLDPLELELQVAVSCAIRTLGIKIRSSEVKSHSAVSH